MVGVYWAARPYDVGPSELRARKDVIGTAEAASTAASQQREELNTRGGVDFERRRTEMERFALASRLAGVGGVKEAPEMRPEMGMRKSEKRFEDLGLHLNQEERGQTFH
ncbi:hypothetical protein LXL04_003604 [Taraxacum kok-saghyz]